MCVARLGDRRGGGGGGGEKESGGWGKIYRIFEILVHSAVCRTRRLHFFTISIYLALFSVRILHPRLPSQFDTLFHLCRRLPLVSARAPILFDNDSRFLNFADTWKVLSWDAYLEDFRDNPQDWKLYLKRKVSLLSSFWKIDISNLRKKAIKTFKIED